LQITEVAREGLAGKLAALVGVEDLRFALPESFFQSLDTEVGARVLDSLHESTYRLYQSMMATR